jgi:hypothetical protein
MCPGGKSTAWNQSPPPAEASSLPHLLARSLWPSNQVTLTVGPRKATQLLLERTGQSQATGVSLEKPLGITPGMTVK